MAAVIDFAPKPISTERLVAGIVTRDETGEVGFTCAIDAKKIAHAFYEGGQAFFDIAYMLCESLAQHWRDNPDAKAWIVPFSGARIADLGRFSGRDAEEIRTTMLSRSSSMHTLLSAYEMASRPRVMTLTERVRAAVKRDANATHLAARFNRELNLGESAAPMRVDFLGQHYACYFLQITSSTRHLDLNTDRAFGKLYELQALQRFVKKPKKTLGLFDDERPEKFELLMVGNRNDSVQRQAIYQVEALADQGSTLARVVSTVGAAAEHVSERERLAA